MTFSPFVSFRYNSVPSPSLDHVLYVHSRSYCTQGCLTRRTWRFGRRFRTRTDGHTCPSVLFRRTFACKNFFTIFFFTVGNFSEADVSNLNPCWRRACADGCARAQTGKGVRRRVTVRADGCMRAQMGKGVRRRVRAGADVCAHPQMLPPACIRLPKKWIPVGSAQGLQQFRVDYLSFKH